MVQNDISCPFDALELLLLVFIKGEPDLEGAVFADARNVNILFFLLVGEVVST